MICSIKRDEKRQVVDVIGADGKSAPIFQELSTYFGSNKDIALMWTLRTNTKAFKDWYGNKELKLIERIHKHKKLKSFITKNKKVK